MAPLKGIFRKFIRKQKNDDSASGHVTTSQLESGLTMDYWIMTARLLKAAGENLPFP
jgi:hypothetical protein